MAKYKCNTYTIYFTWLDRDNSNGSGYIREDSTEFDVSIGNETELLELFMGFVEENNMEHVHISFIEHVGTATYNPDGSVDEKRFV